MSKCLEKFKNRRWSGIRSMLNLMRTEYFLQTGQVITYTKDKPANGLFSLTKFFKKMLDRFHVPYNDDCCDATSDGSNSPVRFNTVTSHLEYYNKVNNTWTTVPHL